MSFNQVAELLFIIAAGTVLIAIGLLLYVLHLIEVLHKKIRDLNSRLPLRDATGRLYRERL
jgi:cbb3-type cytochrome oxidase subunit 3